MIRLAPSVRTIERNAQVRHEYCPGRPAGRQMAVKSA
jgi:hypothetical protein